MKKYEAMFVLDNAFAGKEWEPVEAELRKILERFGAEIETLGKWAERRLAYEIKKNKRAVYVHTLFMMDPERVKELRDHIALDERVLRLLILAFDPGAQTHLAPEEHPRDRFKRPVVKADATPETPAAEAKPETGEKPAAEAKPETGEKPETQAKPDAEEKPATETAEEVS